MSPTIVPNRKGSKQALPTTPPGQPLAVIYARVSTTDQADRGFSLPTQIEACCAWAREHNYEVPEHYIFSEDYTGMSLHRPELAKLRELAQQHLIQAVIVYDQDRLSRKLAHQLLLSEEFDDADVPVYVLSMPMTEKTPETQLFSNMRGVFAEYERAKILERTMRGMRGRAKAGRPPGGRVPLGYRSTGTVYEIHPEEAALVEQIFRHYVYDGLSLNAIAKRLTLQRVPTQRDRREGGPKRKLASCVWHTTSLQLILTNETYIGTMYWGKNENIAGKKNPDKRTRVRRRPKEEWIPLAVPPIITSELFAQAQQQRKRNAQMSRRNRKRDYLFTNGMLRCRQCGSAMSGQWDGRSERLSYRCPRPKYHLETPCRGLIHAASLETYVWEKIEAFLMQPALVAREVAQRQHELTTGEHELTQERQRYSGLLQRCDVELRKWEQAYLDDAITTHDLKEKRAEILARRTSLEHEMARITEEQQVLAQTTIDMRSLEDFCQEVRRTLPSVSNAEKRQIMQLLHIQVIAQRGAEPIIRGSLPVAPIASTAAYYNGSNITFTLVA